MVVPVGGGEMKNTTHVVPVGGNVTIDVPLPLPVSIDSALSPVPVTVENVVSIEAPAAIPVLMAEPTTPARENMTFRSHSLSGRPIESWFNFAEIHNGWTGTNPLEHAIMFWVYFNATGAFIHPVLKIRGKVEWPPNTGCTYTDEISFDPMGGVPVETGYKSLPRRVDWGAMPPAADYVTPNLWWKITLQAYIIGDSPIGTIKTMIDHPVTNYYNL